MMRDGEYAEFRAFLAVADNGSFTLASKVLRVTPSALSQIIKRLEQRVGVQLFNRTTRSVKLTESGSTLFKRIYPAFNELNSAIQDIKSHTNELSGTVKIHSTSTVAECILAPTIAGFFKAYPNIKLDVVVEDAVVDLTQQGFDVGLRLGEYLQNDMIAYPLSGKLRMAAAASPDYLAEYGIPVQPEDLLKHNCINWRYMAEKYVYRWEFFQQSRWKSINVDGSLTSTSRELALSTAIQGAGIVFWTEDKLASYFADGSLVRILEEYCPEFDGWHMYYYRRPHMPKHVRTFIDYMKDSYPPMN
ncbi:LysR substrate-binding domain-containing protein [Vibrio sp. S4M6]|uniref:LysR substrate-binding domain-containing protein n=1 Tax=Vibrio sinus TaxID=2946865 RepID=UPI00202A36EA|nr:LysR substrate-binding domain-containing protein [Vibrio sinus]MCL9780705.1 LysR substrate-binding domain-containing protein [Vibrio sinus]